MTASFNTKQASLRAGEYAPGEMPESLDIDPYAEYVVAETCKRGTDGKRPSRGSSSGQREDGIILREWTTLNLPE